MDLILHPKEQQEYDSLTSKKQKDSFMKAIKYKRKADQLKNQVSRDKRKADSHRKIVIGGSILSIYNLETDPEAASSQLYKALNDEEIKKILIEKYGFQLKSH